MGYHLEHGNGVSTYFPVIDFIKLLELGLLFGWVPQGTVSMEFDRYKFVQENYGASHDIPEELYEEESLSEDETEKEDVGEGEEDSGAVHQLDSYSYNDGNRVTNEDALALAVALEDALGHIPDHTGPDVVTSATAEQYSPHPAVQHVIETAQDFGGEILNPQLAPFQYFAGERKKLIERMIHYCRSGGFFID